MSRKSFMLMRIDSRERNKLKDDDFVYVSSIDVSKEVAKLQGMMYKNPVPQYCIERKILSKLFGIFRECIKRNYLYAKIEYGVVKTHLPKNVDIYLLRSIDK